MFIEQGERTETAAVFPKANLLNRFIAKFVDFLVVALLYEIPFRISFLIGLVYLLIADGFVTGSIGKRLIGLHIVTIENHGAIAFRESIIRNIPFGLAYLAYTTPFIGWLIAGGITGFEFLLIIGNPNGMRLGDEMARTFVLEKKI
ncbi:MAG: RDD family protein [Nitrospirae bacterium]|nr:RDD family protein [Candidatus Troglogloeales bacterium]MBI3597841.1 RDD family protein [Candidatus Troglogloeales bacterium]